MAAIGSSKPTTREIDDTTLERAARVLVESADQAMREAGDLVLSRDHSSLKSKILEIGHLINSQSSAEKELEGITVFKSVGVGIADVALAEKVHKHMPLI